MPSACRNSRKKRGLKRLPLILVLGIAITFLLQAKLPLAADAGFLSLRDMDFGRIYYTSSATGNVKMGSNGIIDYTNGYSGDAIGTPGSVVVTGDIGAIVDISCKKLIYVSDGSNTMKISGLEMEPAPGLNYASGTRCAGIKTPIYSIPISDNPSENTFYIGGKLRGPPTGPGQLDDSKAGGRRVKVRVVYQ